MNPEAYITATRQCVAQANNWSLEELHLDVTILEKVATNVLSVNNYDSSFSIVGKSSKLTPNFVIN